MSMGFSLAKPDLDVRMGTIVVNLRDAFRQAVWMNALLNNTNIIPNDAYLTGSLPGGTYLQAEVTSFRAAFTSLNTLNNVAFGTATVPSVNNFFFEAQKLTGAVL